MLEALDGLFLLLLTLLLLTVFVVFEVGPPASVGITTGVDEKDDGGRFFTEASSSGENCKRFAMTGTNA